MNTSNMNYLLLTNSLEVDKPEVKRNAALIADTFGYITIYSAAIAWSSFLITVYAEPGEQWISWSLSLYSMLTCIVSGVICVVAATWKRSLRS